MTLLMTRPKKKMDGLSSPEESCRLQTPADAHGENLGNHRCHDDVGCEEEDGHAAAGDHSDSGDNVIFGNGQGTP